MIAPRSLSLSLRQNFSWTFMGNVVYAATQWGLLTLLAKLGTPEAVGQFALGLAVTAPVVLFANLQLRGLQATDARFEFAFGDYLGLRVTTTVVFLLTVGAVAIVAGYAWETSLMICAVGATKAVEAISDVYHGLFQQHERMDWVSKSIMLKGVLSMAAMALALYLSGSAVWGVLGMVGVWGAVLVMFDVRNARILAAGALDGHRAATERPDVDTKPRFVPQTIMSLIRLALPLGFVMMLLSLSANIPHYFIERSLGVRELGIFAPLAYVLVAGRTVVGALGQAASPRLARYYAARKSAEFRRLVIGLSMLAVMIGVTGVAVAWLAGGAILRLLYTSEYGAYQTVFIWVMVAGLISYVVAIQGYTMTAARQLRVQVPLTVTVLAITTVCSFMLIPRFGLLGGAWALCAASAVQLALGIVINTRAIAGMST